MNTEKFERKKLLKNKNLYFIFLITLFAVMGVASITPAFPQIVQYYNITPKKVALLITAFTFPGIFLTPVMGVIADRIGRKITLVPSLFLFGIAGTLCAFTKDFQTLIILRFIQGIGATSLGSINITILGDLFSGEERVKAMGYNASVLSIGTATYPFIGGSLALIGWNYPFFLTALAIPLGLFIIWGLKNPEPDGKQKLREYFGNAWKNINQKKVWGLFIINVLIFVILYGSYLTYFPLLLKERFLLNSFYIGLTMSAMSLTTAIVSSLLGKINKIFTRKIQLLLSFLFYIISLLLIAFTTNWYLMFIPVVLFGFGHGMLIPTIQTIMVGYAPLKERAIFMSINSVVLRVGQTIGPVLIGIFFGIGGVTTAFVAGAGVVILILLTFLLVVKKI